MPSAIFGQCPTVAVSAVVYNTVAQLVGFMEFGTLSVPPVLYLNYTAAGGWTYTRALYSTPTWTDVGLCAGTTSGWAWNSTTGVLAGGGSASGVYDGQQTTTNRSNSTNGPTTFDLCAASIPPILSTDGITPSGGNPISGDPLAFPDDTWSGTEFAPTQAINSKTQLTLTMAAASNNYGGGSTVSGGYTDSISAGTLVFNLTNPDTADNAVARINFVALEPDYLGPIAFPASNWFSAGIFSLYETRATEAGLTQFGYATGDYMINFSNLIIGWKWNYSIQWERRTAVGDGSGDTSGYGTTWDATGIAPVTGSFTAAASTFNTASTTMPSAAGYQYRIKSVTCLLA